ncbi:MAG TPA: hypothetical protein VF841_08145 [Anaeromyxobacter sp.]
MTTLNVLAALFAVFMLVRHAPRAVRLLRGEGARAGAMVSLLNVALALGILVMAVKGLAGLLISR